VPSFDGDTNNEDNIQETDNNMSTIKGKVKWFNPTKGFGFIEREDKDKDVFVHVSAVRDAGLDHLNDGEAISFDVEDGPKGPNATNLQKI
jgi:cold shock protein